LAEDQKAFVGDEGYFVMAVESVAVVDPPFGAPSPWQFEVT
jgi:hypothetical protein